MVLTMNLLRELVKEAKRICPRSPLSYILEGGELTGRNGDDGESGIIHSRIFIEPLDMIVFHEDDENTWYLDTKEYDTVLSDEILKEHKLSPFGEKFINSIFEKVKYRNQLFSNTDENGNITLPLEVFEEMLNLVESIHYNESLFSCSPDFDEICTFQISAKCDGFNEHFKQLFLPLLDPSIIEIEYNIEFFRKYRDKIYWSWPDRKKNWQYLSCWTSYGRIDYTNDIFFDNSFLDEFKEYIDWKQLFIQNMDFSSKVAEGYNVGKPYVFIDESDEKRFCRLLNILKAYKEYFPPLEEIMAPFKWWEWIYDPYAICKRIKEAYDC